MVDSRARLGVAVLIVFMVAGLGAQAAAPSYHVARTIALEGDGGWDYVTVDSAAHRAYVTHGIRVQVLDTQTGKVVGEIANTDGVHGVAIAAELGRGFTSNGRANTVTIFDLKTLAVIRAIAVTGENPDAIVYEPVSRRVFTFNGGTASATAIDAANSKVVGTVALPGKPEFAVADGRGRIFVNIQDKSLLATLDAQTLAVGARWPLAPCEAPTGLAIDRQHRRLFAVCGNKLMVAVDADSGRVVATAPIGELVDGVVFDPSSALVFTSNGQGTVTVIRQDAPDKYSVVETVSTKRGAHTIALDETTHQLYLPTAQLGPPPAAAAHRPHPRPSIVPGTFEMLVLNR